MAEALLPNYAQAQLISFTDQRIKARYVEHPSSGGNFGMMRGYFVSPAGHHAVSGRKLSEEDISA